MCQHHGSGIVIQGAFNHFPGMDFRAVDGAGEEGFTGNQLILVVQIFQVAPEARVTFVGSMAPFSTVLPVSFRAVPR
ncbi:Uncharacterised protein [Escherichia coli]|nr:Uncharacterised protein [Escherichia coli]